MQRVINCITTEHDWRLILLAGIVCFLASLAAISLVHRARDSDGSTRLNWILVAGAATGCGIWATHFIAMLAYDPGPAISYDLGLTIASLIVVAVITTVGVALAVALPWRFAPLAGGAVVGAGIAAMHYLGKAALQMAAHVIWRPELVLASIIFGMAFSMVAFAAAMQKDEARSIMGGSVLLTLAIVLHHFTGVSSMGLIPDPLREVPDFTLSPTAIAVAIAGVTMAVIGMSGAGALADRRVSVVTGALRQRIGQLKNAHTALMEDTDAKLRENHLRLETALNNMSQGLVMFDAEARMVICNQRYVDLYGLPADFVKPGVTLEELLSRRQEIGTFCADVPAYVAELRKCMAEGKAASVRAELKDGRVIVVINQPMAGGGWVATHEDVTEQRRAEERIAYLAHHDTLTGLANRAFFSERLVATLEEAADKPDGRFAVLCLDLDRFKEVNDVFGHSAGDLLLQQVAKRLSAAVPEAFVARLGGDEFVMIVPGGTQPMDAPAASLLAAFEDEIALNEQRVRIGVSIGIAVYPTDGEDATTLLANADAALYRAKAEGRGAFRFFQAGMDTRLRERRALQQELRNAVENRQLSVHYQPQARLDGEIVGFEALLRWHHPVRGLVPPSEFIPLAEESGLIIDIGEWTLREACREAATWPRHLQIAINLSPIQFQHGDLPALVHGVLLESGLAPARLELEITESVLIGDFTRAVAILRRLKALGIRIAMDDFGTGYSSLSYLQAFPFDKIKIDRSFISDLERNAQSAAIVRAVIGLAQGLDLPVVAEGVETQAQLSFLERESCNQVQGFFVGRPGPIENYAGLVGRPETLPQRKAAAG